MSPEVGPMARFFNLIVLLACVATSSVGQAQNPVSADSSSDEIPLRSVPQNAPCIDQPRSLSELSASFHRGRFPKASQITGSWVEIGAVDTAPYTDEPASLNCSGIRRGSKFEFVLIANGHSVELHAIGMGSPQQVRMETGHKGSIEFREADFGGEGTLDNYRCRITNRETLACLLGSYRGAEFKKITIKPEQIPND